MKRVERRRRQLRITFGQLLLMAIEKSEMIICSREWSLRRDRRRVDSPGKNLSRE